MTIQVVYHHDQEKHAPETYLKSGQRVICGEVPQRATELLKAVTDIGFETVSPEDHGLSAIANIHTPEYLHFLRSIWQEWSAKHAGEESVPELVIPGTFPRSRRDQYPGSAIGLAGYHMYDTGCPLAQNSWTAIHASAQTAIHATQQVISGAFQSYALCRPPGHHAFSDQAGGFCYLNNSAIAAQMLRMHFGKVAILDLDVHHGNGTQGIFYPRDDMLTVSIHADPDDFYPFYWGHSEERGEGVGLGYNLNIPLQPGSNSAVYGPALRLAIERINSFCPQALVIALGLDAADSDPVKGLSLTTADFAWLGETLAELNLPTVIVQEGGNLSDDFGTNLVAFLTGFGAGRDDF